MAEQIPSPEIPRRSQAMNVKLIENMLQRYGLGRALEEYLPDTEQDTPVEAQPEAN